MCWRLVVLGWGLLSSSSVWAGANRDLVAVARKLSEQVLYEFPSMEGIVLGSGKGGSYVSVGKSSGASQGSLLAVIRETERIRDPQGGEELGRGWDVVGVVRLTEVQDKVSGVDILQGRAERGDRVSSEALKLELEVRPFRRAGGGRADIAELLTDLVAENLDRSGRWAIASERSGGKVPSYGVEGEVVDATATVLVHMRLVRQPGDRVVAFWTESMACTPAIRSLLDSDLSPYEAFVQTGETRLSGSGACACAAAPREGRSVYVLFQDHLEVVRFEGQWISEEMVSWVSGPGSVGGGAPDHPSERSGSCPAPL